MIVFSVTSGFDEHLRMSTGANSPWTSGCPIQWAGETCLIHSSQGGRWEEWGAPGERPEGRDTHSRCTAPVRAADRCREGDRCAAHPAIALRASRYASMFARCR